MPERARPSKPKVSAAADAVAALNAADAVAAENRNAAKDYAVKRYKIATAVSLLGTGAGCYLAYKKGSGVWGYIGYGFLLGGILGWGIGLSVGAIVVKVPDVKA